MGRDSNEWALLRGGVEGETKVPYPFRFPAPTLKLARPIANADRSSFLETLNRT
jgi:hypothetical protein